MVRKMDNEDAQVEANVGSWLVETFRELEIVEKTVFVEVSTLHKISNLISEEKRETVGEERERGVGSLIL